MKLLKLAQSTVRLESDSGKVLLIDPGSYNLDHGILDQQNLLTSDVVVITHKHADHFSKEILEKIISIQSNPEIIVVRELVDEVQSFSSKITPVAKGDSLEKEGFVLKITDAEHIVRDEIIPTVGIIVKADGKTVYYVSDTNYKSPESLFVPNDIIDWILPPFSGRGVTMSAADAVRFIKETAARNAIPVHYDSPKDKELDPHQFASQIESATDCKCTLLSYGEEIEL